MRLTKSSFPLHLNCKIFYKRSYENCISRIIRVRSLFCSTRLFTSMHFLLIPVIFTCSCHIRCNSRFQGLLCFCSHLLEAICSRKHILRHKNLSTAPNIKACLRELLSFWVLKIQFTKIKKKKRKKCERVKNAVNKLILLRTFT